MYKFLDKPVSRQQKREQLQHDLHSASAPDNHLHQDHEDKFETAVRENKVAKLCCILSARGTFFCRKTGEALVINYLHEKKINTIVVCEENQ